MLVDDHMILREGLRKLIERQPDMCVVGEAEDGTGALVALPEARPHVIVMDISMPNLGGVEATVQIKQLDPHVQVLALTAHEEGEYVRIMLRAGAMGYLLKRAAATDLVRAIRVVAAGEPYLDTSTGARLGMSARTSEQPEVTQPKSDLSRREADVLRMIALGYSMKRIAGDLDLSLRTLETYKRRGMTKLALSTRADIVRYALTQGWLKDG